MKRPKVYLSKTELATLLKYLVESLKLDGDICECGVGAGGASRKFMLATIESGYTRKLHIFDYLSSDVIPDMTTEEEKQAQLKYLGFRYNFENFKQTPESLNAMFHAYNLTNYELYPGLVTETAPKFNTPLCFIHGDVDLYVNMKAVSEMAERVLVPGGIYAIHDYNSVIYFGAKKATDELLKNNTFDLVEVTDTRSGTCILRKK